ncbi:MAG TPA: hypothetical protein PLB62_14160 [Candidatus Sumerlaeota bacterium]|nr:hypothetical protein [Candidatus Sumerlaeota bacterium]
MGYLIIFASGNADGVNEYIDSKGHIRTSFKLSVDGENIALIDTDGTTVISAHWDFPLQGSDVSYGKGSNGINGFMITSTPGAANGIETTNLEY